MPFCLHSLPEIPEVYSSSVFKQKIPNEDMLREDFKLSIFDIEDQWLADKICVWGVQEEVKEAIRLLGSSAKACELLNCSYRKLNEWPSGRRPISLFRLNSLLSCLPKSAVNSLQCRIDVKQLYLTCQGSKHKIKFQNHISPDLAYVLGIILGDGYLAGDDSNKVGNWYVGVDFDNKEHLDFYSGCMTRLFGCDPFSYKRSSKNVYVCYVGSVVLHWFFRSFFKLKNGVKHDSIVIPDRILRTNNSKIINACIRGLFDSDGTVTGGAASVSSTSKKVIDQIQNYFHSLGLVGGKYKWLKDPKYKMLYTFRLSRRCLSLFQQLIGFSHPIKNVKLKKLLE